MIEKVMRLLNHIKKWMVAQMVFRRYSCFLEDGVYYLNQTCTGFTKCEHIQSRPIYEYEQLFFRKRREWLLKKKYVCKNTTTCFRGTKLLITGQGKGVKSFNEDRQEVLSAFKNLDAMNVYMYNKKFAEKIMPVAETICFNTERLYVVEEMLKDFSDSSEMKWNSVLESIVIQHDVGPYTYRDFPLTWENEEIKERFSRFYESKGKKVFKLPLCNQHGDLWRANIFCEKYGSYKCVDFDNCGVYNFFYDLAHFVFSEAFLCKNRELLKKYLCGEYDDYIEQICMAYGVGLREIGREVIFICSIEEMINIRFSGKSQIVMANSIFDFLNQFGLMI